MTRLDYRPMRAFAYMCSTLVASLSFAFCTVSTACADELILHVDNIREAGEIHIAIYDDAQAFEADRGDEGGAAPGIIEGTIEPVEPGSVTYRYELPAGTYAIGIFHDANLNNRLDNFFFGIPREQYGFSNNARGFMGPPSFEDAAIAVEGVTELRIRL